MDREVLINAVRVWGALLCKGPVYSEDSGTGF